MYYQFSIFFAYCILCCNCVQQVEALRPYGGAKPDRGGTVGLAVFSSHSMPSAFGGFL